MNTSYHVEIFKLDLRASQVNAELFNLTEEQFNEVLAKLLAWRQAGLEPRPPVAADN